MEFVPANRCQWAQKDAHEACYHDAEWGVPLHDDAKWFEFLILDAAQAGLSWRTILHKREGYRRAFHGFDVQKVAAYTEQDFDRLMADPGIVRNRLKINSAIVNAQRFLEVQARHGSFDAFIWQFTNGKPIQNEWKSPSQIPASTPVSDAMSKELKRLGFKFVGTTICYACMQAAGMVNDHTTDCFRYEYIRSLGE